MPTGSRAAIYARFSTDLQSDRSIDDQVSLCRTHAAKNGLTVTQVYSDRAATSASIIGRDGILRLMEDARAGAFDIVITEALDRISRDQGDLSGIFKRLQFANVEIEAVHDGRADTMQIGLRGLMGEMFLADLKHKVRRGMTGVVRDGRNAGGRAYGYRPVPGQPGELEIVAEEAEIIRRIFAEYLGGKRPREIAEGLNADGILPPRGTRWNASTINGNAARGHGILLNPLYAGEIVWNRVRMVRDPDSGKRVSRANPPEAWQRAPAPQLAILDRDTFDQAQAKKAQRARTHRTSQHRRPKRVFSGLIKCGACGAGMSIHDRAGSAIRIKCSASTESRSCTNTRRYRLDKIERAVIDKLGEQMRHPELLKIYIREYVAERHRLAAEARRDYGKLERQRDKARAALRRKTDLYAEGLIDGDEAKAQIKRLNQDFNAAEDELRRASEPPVQIDLHPQALRQFEDMVDQLSSIVLDLDGTPDAELAQTVRKLIAKITIMPAEKGPVTIDVEGYLSALTGEDVPGLGGRMVAEDRLNSNPLFPICSLKAG